MAIEIACTTYGRFKNEIKNKKSHPLDAAIQRDKGKAS